MTTNRRGDYVEATLTFDPPIPTPGGRASPEPAHHDPVNHPRHYTNHPSGIECIQVTEHMSFTVGNAIKYLWRADLKNGVEDLEKAAWYVNREIEKRKGAAG